jgi:hypothetical protein
MTALITQQQHPQAVAQAELLAAKIATTKQLLAADRKRAADVLLQLHYQFSQQTVKMDIK